MSLRYRRTSNTWEEHELIIREDSFTKIWELKMPNSCTNQVTFINSCNITAVTGDFGNWIFNRVFYPSHDGHVSDGYWVEKLSIASEQTGKEYDQEETGEVIQDLLHGELEKEYEGKELEEMKEYLELCLSCVDDEFHYTCYAYNETPSFLDSEDVVFCTKTPIWLLVVFDAFEEICRRLKDND